MSSVVDEDTAKTINTGRETLGALFSSAQTHLQKVFMVFVVGFIGSFYALRIWIWDFLEATAKAEMSEQVALSTDIITRTPFEVILLQAKIGMFVGILIALPYLLYLSRDALRRRGLTSVVPISKWYAAGFGLTSFVLFWVGVVYAYAIFFPYAFDFLAGNAVSAGVKPSFGITEFTEFIALLTLSFGLAAQLPLFMSVLSYTEIVSYETFRDKWRHSVVAITVFGALFSPPDPFTLIMWAIPLVGLYVFSLGLSKIVTNMRRQGAAEGTGGTDFVKKRLLQFSGVIGLLAVTGAAFVNQGGFEYLESNVYPSLPAYARPEGPNTFQQLAATYGTGGEIVAGLAIGLILGFLFLLGYTIKILQGPVYPREEDIRMGDPEAIDLEVLDADAIEMAPPQVFLEMSEDEMMDVARSAMNDDDREKAQAVIDRYDTLHAQAAEEDGDGDGDDGPLPTSAGGSAAGAGAEPEESGGLLSGTAAGMLDPFTEEETTEDDIGGYAYDFAFILNSLRSKMFLIVGVFMTVMGGTFFWLYQGGLGALLERFLSRVPHSVLAEVADPDDVSGDPATMTTAELIREMDIVIALHPVEVLIFEVKVSVIAAIIAVLPMMLYYAWPAMKERGLAYGDRRVFAVWGGGLLVGFAAGTYLGFFWIAPAVISYLVTDASVNGMVVSYRISSFAWLVIFTTIGIGFLANIIMTMALFHVGGVVSYRTMLKRWRPIVVGIFTVAAIATPKGILTMLIIAFPIAITYMLGLGLLYVLTAGGRLFDGGGGSETVEPEPARPE